MLIPNSTAEDGGCNRHGAALRTPCQILQRAARGGEKTFEAVALLSLAAGGCSSAMSACDMGLMF